MLRALADALVAAVLAPACASCARPLEEPTLGPVCARCWASVRRFSPPFCRGCGDALPSWRTLDVETSYCPRCRRAPPALSCTRAIGPYEGALRDIVHALKYGGRRSLARPLGRLMLETCGEALDGMDVAVPVPLHRRRRWTRGFNQAEDLAGELGLPPRRLLVRVRSTPPQTGLPAARRHANVRGAFRLRWRARVTGVRVLLVDDVCTTGATLDACARVLREEGAADVRAVTAARAVSRTRG